MVRSCVAGIELTLIAPLGAPGEGREVRLYARLNEPRLRQLMLNSGPCVENVYYGPERAQTSIQMNGSESSVQALIFVSPVDETTCSGKRSLPAPVDPGVKLAPSAGRWGTALYASTSATTMDSPLLLPVASHFVAR